MDALFSRSLKAGGRTYFFDVKEAKNKSKYMTISESKPPKEGETKFTRSSIMVFDTQIDQFRDAIDEAMKIFQN
ncbi:MAG TPA: DUF3276 family protein [Bacteroidota bacterium]|nr:DUF3276 family protein [Bacteroidota bacterium]